MSAAPDAFSVGRFYTSDEIQGVLGVGNAGGVRVSLNTDGSPRRMVVLTSHVAARNANENPYHDRIEGRTLIYTGAGRGGDQTLAGVNQRIPQQRATPFPIYGFALTASRRDKTVGRRRWKFLGLLQYIRHYPDVQVDAMLKQRRVWLFEMRIHEQPTDVDVRTDFAISASVLATALHETPYEARDCEIAPANLSLTTQSADPIIVESVRGQLLATSPEKFEHIVRNVLELTGFREVTVTQYSQDGGVDVNAVAGPTMWPIRDLLLQVQAKRWLHTVGRKEIAELRGSLKPFARGAVVTTSHYSKAAIAEASEAGKNPIALVDGSEFAALVHSLKVPV